MYQIIKTFVETGYSNTMILNRTPRFVEGYEAAETAYAIGYMHVLPQHVVERAEAELNAAPAIGWTTAGIKVLQDTGNERSDAR